jgi:transcriptional regulator with XRE-family HTH domain
MCWAGQSLIGKKGLDLSLPIWQIQRMDKLANHLSETGKKPAQLAQELGVEPSTITRILKGERRPSPDLAKRISDATGVPIVDLLYPASPEAA